MALCSILLLVFSPLQGAFAQESSLPEGFHDGNEGKVDVNNCSAFGWAADPDDRDRDLQVQILADGTVVATTTADLLREDVGACTGGTCGFSVNLWDLISKNEEHKITAQAFDDETGLWHDLEATPRTLACLTSVTYFVNTTDDDDDGVCDETHCSLREAINAANGFQSTDIIAFNIPGDPPFTIQPLSSLPAIADPVTIDGTSQPGFAGAPVIELDGSIAGEPVTGLSIWDGNSTIKSLMIDRFSGNGIDIGGSANNIIEGNLLSGNGSGVSIAGENATGNVIRGNLIGTSPDGTSPWPNTDGIWMGDNAHNNTIGGVTAEERNVISGNTFFGISVNSGASQNQFIGNYLGTDKTGSLPLGNGGGILLGSGSNNNMIGGPQPGAGNLISGNWWSGVTIADPGSNGNVVQGNYIGTALTGTTATGSASPAVGVYTLTVMPETVLTYPAGTNIDGFISESADPRAPWSGISVHFQGTGECDGEGGPCPSLLIYRYKLEFAEDTQLTSVAVSGAAFNGPDNILRVLDENMNILGSMDTFGGNSFQTIYLRLSGVVGRVFYIDEFDTSGSWRFRQNIVINGPAPMGNHGNGVLIANGASGNRIGGPEPAARNLISGNFANGVAVFNPGTTGNTVQGNYIGTDLTGRQPLGNYAPAVGIGDQASNNLISGNLISGNWSDGITISNPVTNGNIIQGNLIGTDASGNTALPNAGVGVWVGEGAADTLVGGSEAGQGNLISGNGYGGVGINHMETTGTRVLGNYIGTNRNGNTALPNGGDGVYISANQSVIGGPEPGAGNLISGNAASGVAVRDGATGNIVQGNRIGTDATGSMATGQPGPAVGDYTLTVMPETCPTYPTGTDFDGFVSETDDPLKPWSGTSVHFKGTDECLGREKMGDASLIYRYKLEFAEVTQLTSVAVSGAAFNEPDNVLRVLDENKNVIGMAGTFGGNSYQSPYIILQGVEGRVFYIDEFDTSSTWRFRQSITINGPVSLGNRGNGVQIANGATDNLVGGTSAGAENLISGNGSDAVEFVDPGTRGNRLEGNYIGTDASGNIALPNNSVGIWIGFGASNNIIGGTDPEARNLISGNNGDGISINDAETSGNIVQGNYIGTNASGNGSLSNRSNGVILVTGANNNLIAENLISGNGGDGIAIDDPGTSNNTVQDNKIGSDASGMAALENANRGVIIAGGASANRISGNLISANEAAGIRLSDGGTEGNTIQGNLIGTDITGMGPLGNNYIGIRITDGAANNLIGGTEPGAGNTVAFNLDAGISLNSTAGTGNSLIANSVFSNTALGIDLGEDGVTLNDPGDRDDGPNGLQNYPDLVRPIRIRGSLIVPGILRSTPNTIYRIEFFSSTICDASGYGEGQVYLGFIEVTTNSFGIAGFSYHLPANFSPRALITATATDPNGNTSEFAQCVSATK
jgi:CSLREA domain-containing protein